MGDTFGFLEKAPENGGKEAKSKKLRSMIGKRWFFMSIAIGFFLSLSVDSKELKSYLDDPQKIKDDILKSRFYTTNFADEDIVKSLGKESARKLLPTALGVDGSSFRG